MFYLGLTNGVRRVGFYPDRRPRHRTQHLSMAENSPFRNQIREKIELSPPRSTDPKDLIHPQETKNAAHPQTCQTTHPHRAPHPPPPQTPDPPRSATLAAPTTSPAPPHRAHDAHLRPSQYPAISSAQPAVPPGQSG